MDRISEAKAILAEALKGSSNPYVLSSFGKDSMATIDLCAEFGVRNVLYLEDRDEIVDEEHRRAVIERYGLHVTRMASGRAILYFIKEQPFLLGFPFISREVAIPVPTNIDPYVPGESYTCLDDRLRATHGTPLAASPDCIIAGFKRADWTTNTCRIVMDHLTPEAKAAMVAQYQPISDNGFGIPMACPLLDWSHDDVWEYLEDRKVPVSLIMYDGRTKRPHANPICYRCHDPYGPSLVQCPKLGRSLMNLAAMERDPDAGLRTLVNLGIIQPEAIEHPMEESAHA